MGDADPTSLSTVTSSRERRLLPQPSREGAMDNSTLPPPVYLPFPDDGSGFDTDVVVVGLGPAGGTPPPAPATSRVRGDPGSVFPRGANSPRAHITNHRAAAVLRDLGGEG